MSQLVKRYRMRIAKVDTEKRLVTSWLNHLEDEDGNPIVDSDGDIIDVDDFEDAMIDAFRFGGIGRAEAMHKQFGLGDVVEHFTISRPIRSALGFGKGPAGGILKTHVKNNGLWRRIKSGELSEMSFTGTGERVDA